MADNDNFDPCEYVFSHENAMRRLISLLQSSQSYCTTEECIQDLPVAPQQSAGDDSFFQVLMIWVAVAMIFFLIRPSSLFNRGGDRKPSNNPGPQQPPPDSPVQ